MKRAIPIAALALLSLLACTGDTGPAGPAGPDGPQGADGVSGPIGPAGVSVGVLNGLVRNADTQAPIAGASVVVHPIERNAASGADGRFTFPDLPIGVYTLEILATGFEPGAGTASVLAGQSVDLTIDLAVPEVTTGIVTGVVRRHAPATEANRELAGARVVLIDAAALAASAERAPMEALAATSPYAATTDAAGAYTISGVVPGRYFVHAAPKVEDATTVLPGGDASRTSFDVVADTSVAKDLVLSQQPSPAATYLGTSTCLLCHSGATVDQSNWKHTLHANVYRLPDQVSANQNLSRLPNHDSAHAFFKDGNPRDNTGAGDGLGLVIASAVFTKFPTNYNLILGFDTRYFVQFQNTASGVISGKYYADFTFGGHGVYKERWVTRVSTNGTYDPTPGGNSSYYILPLQFDEALQAGVEPFHPYNPANWGPPTVAGGPAVRPAQNKSFDNNCAGCHFTGTSLTVDAEGNFHADATDTMGGPFDYDGVGGPDDVAIGCEACHGPGSEHIAGGPGIGKRIVMPSKLSAERSNQVCGNCHTRGVGKGTLAGSHSEYPSAGTGPLTFPRPGIGLAQFLTDFHSENPGLFGDDAGHSRQHHQQWNDFVRSTHAKNQFELLACDDCHDLHDRAIGPSLSARVDDNSLCLSCHHYYTFGLGNPPWLPQVSWSRQAEAEAVSAHMTEEADMTVGYDPLDLARRINDAKIGGVGRCTSCHMPRTAASQSRWVHQSVDSSRQPTGPRVRGDVSSHLFDIITPAASQSLFNGGGANNQLANSCGNCHNAVTGVQPQYAY
jgi:hypothetical protein